MFAAMSSVAVGSSSSIPCNVWSLWWGVSPWMVSDGTTILCRTGGYFDHSSRLEMISFNMMRKSVHHIGLCNDFSTFCNECYGCARFLSWTQEALLMEFSPKWSGGCRYFGSRALRGFAVWMDGSFWGRYAGFQIALLVFFPRNCCCQCCVYISTTQSPQVSRWENLGSFFKFLTAGCSNCDLTYALSM